MLALDLESRRHLCTHLSQKPLQDLMEETTHLILIKHKVASDIKKHALG